MGNGCTPTGIGFYGGGKCRYRPTRSVVMVAMATLEGGGGRYTASLCHPLIRIHASQMRGGSDVRRDSTVDPALAALQSRSSCMLALIMQLIALESC